MSRLTDDDVAHLIRDMSRDVPRTEASDDFTDRVLTKLDRSLARRSRLRRGVAVLTLVLVTGAGAWTAKQKEQSRAAAERLQTLKSEYRELQSELEKLRALAAEVDPVLELGGTEEVDFVFDLRDMEASRRQPAAQPVSHEPGR